ncbi:cytoplasmic polyadenylation element-binding protein 3-like [Artemia franciscana]|uniref:RRM domain-containing protein n=1 Tax=Artemia franciscana TaxID=6661 RepID=A0AA88L4Z8_ARTSF|nr:hypothetical protein QYM36_011596 [Artemia franciscana]
MPTLVTLQQEELLPSDNTKMSESENQVSVSSANGQSKEESPRLIDSSSNLQQQSQILEPADSVRLVTSAANQWNPEDPSYQSAISGSLNANAAAFMGRRPITASHNSGFRPGNPYLKHGYVSWSNGQQSPVPQSVNPSSWSSSQLSGVNAWARGRSVSSPTSLQPFQNGGNVHLNRRTSPTLSIQQQLGAGAMHNSAVQQVISPNKYRKNYNFPPKGPFGNIQQHAPHVEVTGGEQEQLQLMYQQERQRSVMANNPSPLDSMRNLELYLNDYIRPDQIDSQMKAPLMYGIDETQQIMFDETTAMNMQGMGYNGMGGVTSMGFGLGMGLDGTYPILSPSRASPRSQGSADNGERFSRKVFVGGLPPDIDEEEITASFRHFGPLVVDWPHKAESKSYFPPKGYAFLLFQDESSVQKLIDACIQDEDKLYLCVSSPTIKDKPVQIRPWRLSDADFVLDATLPLDPRKTVFVGGVPRPLKAVELAMIMDRLYGGVCYAGIDTDPELRYPKGAGRVAFSNQQSYIAAISARFVQLQHQDIDKRVEVKPYVLDDQMCDECQGARCGGKFAPFFCANVTCLQYYCEHCWAAIHSRAGREFHKPLVKEGADRPRTIHFRW